MSTNKTQLRKIVLAGYEALDENYIISADSIIRDKLLALDEYRDANVIYTYYSMGREVDTRGFITRALADGKTVLLPVITGSGVMMPRRLKSIDTLVNGKFGIPVPPENEPFADQADIDLILVPGLAFDQAGFRLGHGGGYYDRLLSTCDAYAVGLAREKMIFDELPTEKHDRAVDCIVTEKYTARLR